MSSPTIAIVGNPNCGKTTLFNGLTGGRVKTGNWPGVTVEKREGVLKYGDNKEATVVDLPGIYTFSAYSEDEKVARDYILSGEPSLIINIIDAANLERNLYLTTQLIEMKVPMIIIANKMDMVEKEGIKIDWEEVSKRLSLPIFMGSAINKGDVKNLKKEIEESLNSPTASTAKVEYPNEMESAISELKERLAKTSLKLNVNARWISVKLLEGDLWVKEQAYKYDSIKGDEIEETQKNLKWILGDTTDVICADYRYGYIHGILKKATKERASGETFTDKVDKIVLHRALGIPIFFFMMYLLFWSTITVGGAFIDFFDILFGTIFVDGLGAVLERGGAPLWLKSLLADGIGGGIQTVSTFIPIIFMMFFMLSLFEDSGYMARAAFIMDRFMRAIGLPGKSFVPLLIGFGCTVPAIMATRTLENRRERLLTMFMSPLMSCGARLPVYALFVAAFFPRKGGLILFSIYMTGIFFAILTGLLLKKSLYKGEVSYFIMELPSYHTPRMNHILLHTWDRLKGFIIRAGKVIILAVLVLNGLNSLKPSSSDDSLLVSIGKGVTPIFTPMGIEEHNWPATVGIFTGIFAKEAVIGTLNSLYREIAGEEEEGDEEFNLGDGIKEAFLSIPEGLQGIGESIISPFGSFVGYNQADREALADEIEVDSSIFNLMSPHFTKGGAQVYAYLLFILLYFPCVAAFGAIVKEAGPLFGAFNALYLTLLAWVTSTLFFQVTVGKNPTWIAVSLLLALLVVLSLFIVGNRKRETMVN